MLKNNAEGVRLKTDNYMTILDEITDNKRIELVEMKKVLSLDEIKEGANYSRTCFSLKDSLLNSKTGIISEFKRRSPSKGDIHKGINPEEVVPLYEEHGASGVSCLADNKYFGGSYKDVMKARECLKRTPLLFKEFTVDPYQLHLAKYSGADVVLLIAACLEVSQCQELADEAHSLGLQCILEVHTEDELSHYSQYIDIVGVNNRNLKIFKTDIQNSINLAKNLPSEAVKISESGISNPATVMELRKHGFNGFLMGENFMKEQNPGLALRDFIAAVSR